MLADGQAMQQGPEVKEASPGATHSRDVSQEKGVSESRGSEHRGGMSWEHTGGGGGNDI